MATTYKIEDVTNGGEVTVSVAIDGRSHSGYGFMDVGDINDSLKIKAFAEKLCAQTEVVLEKIIATKKDHSLIIIDPVKVQLEKGLL